MLPKKKPFEKEVYRAFDVGFNECIDEVKPYVRMLEACLAFTWSAIVFGIVIGMIGVWG
jgi:hypothetical protein